MAIGNTLYMDFIIGTIICEWGQRVIMTIKLKNYDGQTLHCISLTAHLADQSVIGDNHVIEEI